MQPAGTALNTYIFPDTTVIDSIVDTCPILSYEVTAMSSKVVYSCSIPDLSVGCRTIQFPIVDHETHTVTYSVITARGHVNTISLTIKVECDLITTT